MSEYCWISRGPEKAEIFSFTNICDMKHVGGSILSHSMR